MKKSWSRLLSVLMALVFGVGSALAQPALAPAPRDWVQAFSAIQADPPPKMLSKGSHFVVSDEDFHELFRETILGRGGLFLGVGTDPNYTMAAWAKPEYLILLDFDQVVVSLHGLYRLAFLNAKDANDFMTMWRGKDGRLKALMVAEWPDPKVRAPYERAYKLSHLAVARKLRWLKKHMAEAKVPFFLSDPEQFQWLVGLFRANRVFAVRGDLTADTTVLAIGAAAKKVNLPVRVLYLTNAETYFQPYPESYKRNMLALPMDERSIVVRTCGTTKSWSPDDLYEYIVQDGANFQRWMAALPPKSKLLSSMGSRRAVDRQARISRIVREPPEKWTRRAR